MDFIKGFIRSFFCKMDMLFDRLGLKDLVEKHQGKLAVAFTI